jgi:hypothetical protein
MGAVPAPRGGRYRTTIVKFSLRACADPAVLAAPNVTV